MAVRFLASEEAGYITGRALNVNGGMYMQGQACWPVRLVLAFWLDINRGFVVGLGDKRDQVQTIAVVAK